MPILVRSVVRCACPDVFERSPPYVATSTVAVGRNVQDIVALISGFREDHGFSAQFQITQPNGNRQDVHLSSGIVDEVFAFNRMAGCLENPGKAGAERGSAAVSDMQGSGRIGGDVFDQDALFAAGRPGSVIRSLAQDLIDDLRLGFRPQLEVDESRACHLRGQQVRVLRQVLDDLLG